MIKTNLNDGKYKISILPKLKPTDINIIDDYDKFLFDVGKTVGFRKDKKINKFVGIRNGYSKQLEFTIHSITLDGKNLIPKNRVNFNSVELDGDLVVHKMNNIKILNKVTKDNFKNLVEIEEPFRYFEVIYEVHIKGIKVDDKIMNNHYNFNIKNQFTFVDDINGKTLFIIDMPIAIDKNGKHHKFLSHELYIENNKLYYKKIAEYITNYDFPLLIDTNIIINTELYTDGVGVLESTGNTWNNASGGLSAIPVHSSSVGTFQNAIGVSATSSNFTINKTFLKYDTNISSTDVLSSVKLKLFNIGNSDAIVDISTATQSNTINVDDWSEGGTFIISGQLNNGGITEFDIPFTYIDINGFTKFMLSESTYYGPDIEPSSGTTLFTGLDFSRTTLEFIFEPVKVYGQTQKNVVRGNYFYLHAFTNSGTLETIEWYRHWDGEDEYSGFLTSGSTYMGFSMDFVENNKIYAVKSFTNSPTVYSIPLEVTINVMNLDYEKLPNRLVHYDAIDMDSIYFKFYKCLSGVCYTYVRDLDNIYEGNLLVSDMENDESYNLYNEFDIIDDFFIKSSIKVDVAFNENLDLSRRTNFIDGVIIREGTRVLLLNQNNPIEKGIYVAKYDNRLIKTDELDNLDKLFRAKIHVRYGSFTDQEIHVNSVIVI